MKKGGFFEKSTGRRRRTSSITRSTLMLAESGRKITVAKGLTDAAQKVVAAAKGAA